MSLSSKAVAAQLAALDATVLALNREADALSLAAVAGNAEAASRLSEIMSQLRQADADRGILQRAISSAESEEAAAAAAVDGAERDRHREIAAGHAARLIELASMVDGLVSGVSKVLSDLSTVEHDVWRSLHAAGDRPANTVIGRRNISALAGAEFQAVLNGLAKYGRPPISIQVQAAWRFLTDEERGAADE